MPLTQYGLLKGDLFTPQEQTYQGNWFHGIFYLTVPGTTIPRRCVTDFSSANKNRIQYKIFNNLTQGLFAAIMALPDGYASLGIGPVNGPTSGALDYIRSPILASGSSGGAETDGWIVSDGKIAVNALQKQLDAKPQKMFVFGEPFTDPAPVTQDGVRSQNGMHNVHMNQGDPAKSPDGQDHQIDDGIWQDGATIFLNTDGSLTAFCSKFVAQSFNTNDQGLPA
jgi:uncharacterized protein YukJ